MIPSMLAQASDIPPLPLPDAAGIPGAAWLFVWLMNLTFTLHVLFMNLVLGGSAVLLGCEVAGRARLAHVLTGALPIALSFTITFGVAPLLFVQVLYPQFFYTANVLIGPFWLGILAALLLAFYGIYLVRRWQSRPSAAARAGRALGAALILALVLAIGYVFSGNAVIAIEPQQWRTVINHDRVLHVSSPQFLPRYLHMVIGATAVSGLGFACLGQYLWRRRGEPGLGRTLVTRGMSTAVIATFAQMADGLWFLLAVSDAARTRLLNPLAGGAGSIAWMLAILASLLMLWMMIRAALEADVLRWTLISAALMFATLFGMSAGREVVRQAYLAAYFRLDDWTVSPQPWAVLVFLATFLAGLAVLALMLRWWWGSTRLAVAADRAADEPPRAAPIAQPDAAPDR